MISPAEPNASHVAKATALQVLVRYGNIPMVARYMLPEDGTVTATRGSDVVIQTDRGIELGHVLDLLTSGEDADTATTIERAATDRDRQTHHERQKQSSKDFEVWQQRVSDWKLELELIDLERTLDDDKVILYVLNDQNAETTRLALLAAAAGLGMIHVQPVSAEGIIDGSGGGCGSGCGCGH